MSNYSQQLANAIAAMTKTTISGMLALSTPASEKPRSVAEILDVRNSFVDGYPQHVESTTRERN